MWVSHISNRQVFTLGVVLALCVLPAQAKTKSIPEQTPLTPQQLQLVQKSIAQEKVCIQEIQKHAPLVQTYIQNMRPDPKFYEVPKADDYMLSRVDFSKVFVAKGYESKPQQGAFFKGSVNAVESLTRLFRMSYTPGGFMEMMFIDPSGYDLQHYDFSFVRNEFLGNVRTVVFDVHPKPGNGSGRFVGRVWIEDRDGNIVRFNGSYSRGSYEREGRYWVHFDSWRTNVQPGVWLPTAIYAAEDNDPESLKPEGGFRAQTHFWGYSLKLPTQVSENESVRIDNVIDQSQSAQDLSPIEAQREWNSQAEHNVLDRLVEAGLLAPPSDFDKVLEQITNNVIIGNKLVLSGDIHCRVLLTTPLESLAVGNTILISQGLVDVLPSEADLAAVLTFQLAQIVLGHVIDTRYAFSDQLLFPDEVSFRRLRLNHSNKDDVASAQEAIKLLYHSVYKDKLADVAVFLAELQSKEKTLKALMTPNIGDSVINPGGVPWLAGVSETPVRLEPENIAQIAALPLGSHLKTDPWDDKVIYLHTAAAQVLTARDKMPLEIAPIYLRLRRYDSSDTSNGANAGSTSGSPSGGTPAGDDPTGASGSSPHPRMR